MAGGDFAQYKKRYEEYSREFEQRISKVYIKTRSEEVSQTDHKQIEANRNKREEVEVNLKKLEFRFRELERDIQLYELREEKEKWENIVADIKQKITTLEDELNRLKKITILRR